MRKIERNITKQDLLRAADTVKASTLDWLRTARNLVKYAGADDSYSDVEQYLRLSHWQSSPPSRAAFHQKKGQRVHCGA